MHVSNSRSHFVTLQVSADKQILVTNKAPIRRRPRPPDLPKKRRHKTVRIALPKNCISNTSIKSFKPTISLQKLFAGTSPRLVVKDSELQPAVALTEQYNTLPKQHPVHNWTIGIKKHKFKIYTKWLCALCKLKLIFVFDKMSTTFVC